jgi:hypothetical protein
MDQELAADHLFMVEISGPLEWGHHSASSELVVYGAPMKQHTHDNLSSN